LWNSNFVLPTKTGGPTTVFRQTRLDAGGAVERSGGISQ